MNRSKSSQTQVGGLVPPQDIEAEKIVLGTLISFSEAKDVVFELIDSPFVFYTEQHQSIFKACHELFKESQPIDLVTVTSRLRKLGKLEFVGGAYYITDICNYVHSVLHLEPHCKIIKDHYLKREIIYNTQSFTAAAFDETTDAYDVLKDANAFFSKLTLGSSPTKSKTIGEIGAKRIIDYNKIQDKEFTGIPCGLTDIDSYTGGWQQTDLIVLAGRPAMGKTSFATMSALNSAIRFKKKIGIFSLEMSAEQLFDKLLSQHIGISVQTIRKGRLTEDDHRKIQSDAHKLLESKIVIDDSSHLTIYDFQIKARKMIKEHEVDMIIIDYLQLMSGPTGTKGAATSSNRDTEIGAISRGLKAFAKEANIPVLALSQLSRAVEARGGAKRPILADLRESGNIEQDADMVLFIYRPEYYGFTEDSAGNDVRGIAQIIIAKYRQGSVHTDGINVKFNQYNTGFYDVDKTDTNFESLAKHTWQARLENKSSDDLPF